MKINKCVLYISILSLLLTSCFKGIHVDCVIHNAQVHTMDAENTVAQAIAFHKGKIVEIGPERQILNKYTADEEIDAQGKDVYPGFNDSHGHLLLYAQQKLSLDLHDCLSFDEMLVRIERFASRNPNKTIVGKGWDHSLWSQKELPTNERINDLFPNRAVVLYRVDEHTALLNQKALDLAKINLNTQIDGGEIQIIENKLSGIISDNALNLIETILPQYTQEELSKAILEIQDELLQYGITGVHEAGINFKDIALFKHLIQTGKFHINLYAMLMATPENIEFARKNGPFQYKNLKIQSFKVMADGAIGSYGALLKSPYSDNLETNGTLLTSFNEMKRIALLSEQFGYQMNTHAIGDQANFLTLQIIKEINETNKDHRWRIEHAQVIDSSDLSKYGEYGVFPSIQPTHAMSDYRWVKDRLGENRMLFAYSYKSLLKQSGMIAIGTDFPVEDIDPFTTIHTAVQRTPIEGGTAFKTAEGISLEECIKGMTIWSAWASFQENEIGSLEAGKDATLVIFESPVKSSTSYSSNFANTTFIKGKKVYSVE
jgi:predicted amidohydrolase YtcJ